MKKIICILSIGICSLYSCKKNDTVNVQEKKDTLHTTPTSSSKRIDANTNDTTYVSLKNNEAFVNFVKPQNASSIIAIDVENIGSYQISLDRKQLKYIRISQITDTQNQSDGPFDKEVNYEFSTKGRYYIIISENQMISEGPETGDALLRIIKK